MGFFDKDNNSLFGRLFDLNGDGKTTMEEEFLAFKIFEECTKSEDPMLSDNSDHSNMYEWREHCDDGIEFGIFPEDYENEEEYEEALNEAKYSWREECVSVFDTGIDPEDYETEDEYNEVLAEAQEELESDEVCDFLPTSTEQSSPKEINPCAYPNRRRYNAAYELSQMLPYFDKNDEYDVERRQRWEFILNNADKIVAANYLTHEGDFLYAQAIKDNFELPCALPDEDEEQKMRLYQILTKIAKRDTQLSFEIWAWCLEQFSQYIQYARSYIRDKFSKELSEEVIENICIFFIGAETYHFPDDYKIKLVNYMNDNPDFLNNVMNACEEVPDGMTVLIAAAFNEQLYTVAEHIFKSGLKQAQGQRKQIIGLTQGVLSRCKDYEELESMEYFRDNLLPLVKNIEDDMVQDEIEGWEQEIAEYIDVVEKKQEKYKIVKEKYGVDINDFKTHDEYTDAFKTKFKEISQQKNIKAQQRTTRQLQNICADNNTIYTYCGVILPFSSRQYNFRTEDETIQIGDKVVVPVGKDDKETEGTVVSVGQYMNIAVPYPIEKTKVIIRKIFKETDN